MSDKNKPRAAAKPPLTGSERVAAWKERHKPKRKVAEIPHDLAVEFEEKLQVDGKSYQSWVIEQIKKYIAGGIL